MSLQQRQTISNLKMLKTTCRGVVASVCLIILVVIKCDGAPSVIIVGAGPAGIAAAAKLLENNITDVTILEAEQRIGGRIYSVNFGEAKVDLGAQWCHGEEDNIVYELVKDLDLLEPGELLLNFYYSSHEELDQTFIDELYELFNSIVDNDKDANETYSLGDYILERYNENVTLTYGNDTEKIKFASEFLDYLMKTAVSLEGAFSWYDVSAQNDYEQCEGNQILSWKGRGYETILDVLIKKYPDPEEQLPIYERILLNKDVVRIMWDYGGQGALALCSDGRVHRADHIIFTPSLGVLKDRYKTMFLPSLPQEKVNAIEELGIGAVVKVFLHFPVRWWPADDFMNFLFIWTEEDKQLLLEEFPEGPNENGTSWLTGLLGVFVADESPNVLTAWFSGEFVPEIELCSDDLIIDGVLFILNKFAGHQFDDIPKPESIIRHGWYSNPHFRGTYSYQTVESRKREVSAETVLSEPLTSSNGKQTVLFAGEATHPYHYSTVHGAIETGFREAQRIIDFEEDN